MTRFGLGALQLPLCARDNLAQIAEEVASAKRRMPWIDMIVVGELAAYGPSLAHAQSLPGTAERAFAAMARDNAVWLVNGSLYEEAEGRIYNTATAFAPDGSVVARHRKVYPFHPYEKGVEGGTDATVFEVPGVGRFGLLICYDIWFPELWRSAALQGAHVLINTVMTNTIDRDAELTLSRAAAIANQLYVVGVNVAGELGVGQSAVYGPGGEAIHLAGSGRELIAIELDIDHVERCRAQGYQRLGQVLKTFREGPQAFPAYARPPRDNRILDDLGPTQDPARSLQREESHRGDTR
jgi:predicted amidohydrolase